MRSVMGGEFDKGVVCKFLVDSDGCYYNERLDSEASKRKEYSASRTKNRMSKETTTYDKDMSDICGTHLPHMENVNIDVNIDVTDTVNKSNTSVTIPPKLADVKAYCLERGNHVDAQQFIDYYETRGWMAGKAKMKNWHSAIHTWEKNNFSNDSAKGGEPAPNWKVRPND